MKKIFLPNERLLLYILEWRNTKFLKSKDFLRNTPTNAMQKIRKNL